MMLRKDRVYLSGIPISGLFTLGAGFSQNISALTVCRFFAGFFSSPGLSIGTGTIADIWHPNERGFPMAAFVTSVQMGPALGSMPSLLDWTSRFADIA